MADALDNLKKRYRLSMTAYQNPTGIVNLIERSAAVVETFKAKFKLTNEDTLTRLSSGVHDLVNMKGEGPAKDREWCSDDEWIELCCWFLFKRPRVFKARWSGWLGGVFDVLDQDQDGYIKEAEFSFFYQSTCRRNDKAWISRAFCSIDLSNSGQVSRN